MEREAENMFRTSAETLLYLHNQDALAEARMFAKKDDFQLTGTGPAPLKQPDFCHSERAAMPSWHNTGEHLGGCH